jgi:acetyl-CoA carboxylase biotin carboxyl carrier protein
MAGREFERIGNLNGKKTGKKPPGVAADGGAASPMDVQLLQQIVTLMAVNDLNTVDVRDGDRRIILKRGVAMASAPVLSTPVAGVIAPPALSAPSAPPPDADAGLKAIKSPMVGTFYAAPSPDAKPFVAVGSTVDEESDVCVIEAMKVFNNIKAECRGTIAKILVQNGQPVEFGQTLFLVK